MRRKLAVIGMLLLASLGTVETKVVFEDSPKTLLQKAAYDAVVEFSAGYGK